MLASAWSEPVWQSRQTSSLHNHQDYSYIHTPVGLGHCQQSACGPRWPTVCSTGFERLAATISTIDEREVIECATPNFVKDSKILFWTRAS